MNSKIPLVAFPVLLYNTLLGHFTVPKFIVLCNGTALTPEEDDTCFGMVRDTAHTEHYNYSLLIEFGTFISRCWATLPWWVTMSNLTPLLNYFYATALTKANISLNIIHVCIFHSCPVSRENIPPLRSALLWQGNDTECYSCYKTITLPSFPSFLQKNCSQCWLNKPAPQNTARYQPQTLHRFDCKCFLESMSRTNSLRNLTTVF